MSDEEFIDDFERRLIPDRALFSIDEINRLLLLAGKPLYPKMPSPCMVLSRSFDLTVTLARDRIREQQQ